MAGEVFRIVGRVSGEVYGSMCLPAADDYETAWELNALFDSVKRHVKWADREPLEVTVAYPDDVGLSEI